MPVAGKIRITNSRLVSMCLSLNPPSEPMDLLLCCHRRDDTEDSTPPPGEIRFSSCDNRSPPPDASDAGSAGSDDGQSSDDHQPESSAAASKRTTSIRTRRSGNTTKKTGRTHRINWAEVGESVPESSGMQASVPRANLGTHVLWSSSQGELETDLVCVTGPPGPRNWPAPASVPRPAPVNGPGWGAFLFRPLPLPLSRPPPLFNAPNTPPSMDFLRPGPGFFVYSPLKHCSFDS